MARQISAPDSPVSGVIRLPVRPRIEASASESQDTRTASPVTVTRSSPRFSPRLPSAAVQDPAYGSQESRSRATVAALSELKQYLLGIVMDHHAAALRHIEVHHKLAVAQLDEALQASLNPTDGIYGGSSQVYNSSARSQGEFSPLPIPMGGTVTFNSQDNDPIMASRIAPPAIATSASLAAAISMQSSLPPPPGGTGRVESDVSHASSNIQQNKSWMTRGSSPSEILPRISHRDTFIRAVADRVLGDVDPRWGDELFSRLAHGDDHSSKLDTAAGIVVMLNTLYIVVELQYVGYESAIALDMQSEDGGWSDASSIFYVVDHVFNSLYIAEMLLRLCRLRSCGALWKSHWFDLVLVLSSSIDLYLLQPLNAGMGTLNILRIVRVFKVLRALRVARLMSLFGELRILVTTVYGCFRALFWSMVLLGMIMAMGGMFMCRLLQGFVLDESRDYNHRVWVYRYYGSSFRAMYTMFELTLSGCWPNYVRPILDHVSPWYAVVFMSYIAGVVFAVIRIITAIFLKRTLQVASQDEELMIVEKMKERDNYLRKLKIFFEEADASGDGAISLDEFERILSNPKVRSWFQLLELEFHEADHLFRLLDDGDGFITIDEFIRGLMRLKGHSWSIDVVSLQREVDRISTMVAGLVQEFQPGCGATSAVAGDCPSPSPRVHTASMLAMRKHHHRMIKRLQMASDRLSPPSTRERSTPMSPTSSKEHPDAVPGQREATAALHRLAPPTAVPRTPVPSSMAKHQDESESAGL